MPISIDPEQQRQQLLQLQPRGVALPVDVGSLWVSLLDAISEELTRAFNRLAAIADAFDPGVTHELLPDWEAILELPFSPELAAIEEMRRQAVIFMINRSRNLTAQSLIDAAALFGAVVTITEFTPSTMGVAVCGDEMLGADCSYYFEVHIPSVAFFEAYCGATVCGDPMGTVGNEGIKKLIDTIKPLHKTAIYVEA